MTTSHGNLAGSRSKTSAHCSLLTALCPLLSALFLFAACPQETDDTAVKNNEAQAETAVPLNSISALEEYLDGKIGYTAKPIPVILTGFNFEAEPELLSNDISAAVLGKYITLDLSACTMRAEFSQGLIVATARIVALTLPDSVTGLGTIAGAGDPSPSEMNGAFNGFGSLRVITAPEVTSVGDYAFNGCTALKSITMPKLQKIGKAAFSGSALTGVLELPEVTETGIAAFDRCSLLTTVKLPKAAKIGAQSFSTCAKLTTVEIPCAATIGGTAFSGTELLFLRLGASPPVLESRIVSYYIGTLTISIPSGSVEVYENWHELNRQKLGNGIPQIIFSEL
jgi:hypothetical protein